MMARERLRMTVDCSKGDRTKQSFKDECDIHNILGQFNRTGLITHLAKNPPQFVDVSEMPDYQTAMNSVIAAGELFMELPADVRERFDNSASAFLDFCADPDNVDEMKAMGLFPSQDEIDAVDPPIEVPAEPVVEPSESAGE